MTKSYAVFFFFLASMACLSYLTNPYKLSYLKVRTYSLSLHTSIFLCILCIHSWKNHIFLKDFIYLFLDKREGREKERERNNNVWLPPTWDLACNPGMCSRLGIERLTLWFEDRHSTTEPHQAGWKKHIFGSIIHRVVGAYLHQSFQSSFNGN